MTKFKISMTCVYKDYEGKIKMLKEQLLQLKIKFLLSYLWKLLLSWVEWTFGGGIKIWWGESTRAGPVVSLLYQPLLFYGKIWPPPPPPHPFWVNFKIMMFQLWHDFLKSHFNEWKWSLSASKPVFFCIFWKVYLP